MDIHFTKGGMSLILNNLSDIIKNEIADIKPEKIIINTSSQPNSKPHLGTLTTLMTTFALAEKFQSEFKIPTIVRFDELENSPFEINGPYYISLGDYKLKNGSSIADNNMKTYIDIFEKLKNITNINYEIRTYKEFQKINVIRENLITILNNPNKFDRYLNPSNISTYVRTKCPECNLSYFNPKVKKYSDHIDFEGSCPVHGNYRIRLLKDNSEYIDMNTQLRDLLKGVHIAKEKENHILEIMCDGSDWSGEWTSNVHYKTMLALGFNSITTRFFTPTIVDESGGKFSKSVYLKNDSYIGDEKLFADYKLFYDKYKDEGWLKIFNEVKKWVSEPMRFFRSYSWEYIKYIVEKE